MLERFAFIIKTTTFLLWNATGSVLGPSFFFICVTFGTVY